MRHIQRLYRCYSRLHLDRAEDRPIAMHALERWILRVGNFEGGYGILVDAELNDVSVIPHRTLLWQRDKEVTPSMTRIDFPADFDHLPPTWSWMAYEGAIDYMDIPYDNVDWESDNIRMPRSNDLQSEQALIAPAWLYRRDMKNSWETKFVYDIQDKEESEEERCIILGQSKYGNEVNEDAMCF
jgi:hypothetical protein